MGIEVLAMIGKDALAAPGSIIAMLGWAIFFATIGGLADV
jgi:hypothetical protein